ncbi:hypothetical protein Ahy_A05g022715 isoform A [Arachis hypogaea]|uniref:Uncharacterized protein n=1 Tax=Arachis hypogaea TaxID=3818 RepID=A0A445D1E9_ARAHY|nr:hypothetical protein Ahy_A05g022715 isoform A [Arachis hypogaea]
MDGLVVSSLSFLNVGIKDLHLEFFRLDYCFCDIGGVCNLIRQVKAWTGGLLACLIFHMSSRLRMIFKLVNIMTVMNGAIRGIEHVELLTTHLDPKVGEENPCSDQMSQNELHRSVSSCISSNIQL